MTIQEFEKIACDHKSGKGAKANKELFYCELADVLYLSSETIKNKMNGRTRFMPFELIELANYLQTDLNTLVPVLFKAHPKR